MDELKKCPFCGGEAKLVRCNSGYKTNPTTILDSWKVQCKDCCVHKDGQSVIYQNNDGEVIIDANGAEIAVELWNNREE